MLKWFRSNEGEAKSACRRFVKKGIDQGRSPDLVGGGLPIRSQGGWSAVKALRRLGVRKKSDERILSSGEFVEQLIQQSDSTGCSITDARWMNHELNLASFKKYEKISEFLRFSIFVL